MVTLGLSAPMPLAVTYLGSSCTLSAREAGEARCSVCSNFSLQGRKDSIHVSQGPVDIVSGSHSIWEPRVWELARPWFLGVIQPDQPPPEHHGGRGQRPLWQS